MERPRLARVSVRVGPFVLPEFSCSEEGPRLRSLGRPSLRQGLCFYDLTIGDQRGDQPDAVSGLRSSVRRMRSGLCKGLSDRSSRPEQTSSSASGQSCPAGKKEAGLRVFPASGLTRGSSAVPGTVSPERTVASVARRQPSRKQQNGTPNV